MYFLESVAIFFYRGDRLVLKIEIEIKSPTYNLSLVLTKDFKKKRVNPFGVEARLESLRTDSRIRSTITAL